MERILVTSSSDKSITVLSEILNHLSIIDIDNAKNAGETRRKLLEYEYDILIINTPLKDENGIELAIDLCEGNDIGIILLAKAENADFIQERVENYGVFVVPKPLNRQSLYQAIKFVGASRKRILTFRAKQTELEKKIEDLKVIDRAKCCLIQYLNMTEPAAHRYIEKQAMDMRVTKRAVAESVIKMYEM